MIIATLKTPNVEKSADLRYFYEEFLQSHKHTNRLICEKSPYLLQNAHNPVDWYPWGPEVFQKAARESKAVFLSISYS